MKNSILEEITFPAAIKKLKEVIEFLKKDMQKHHLSEKAQFNMVVASEEIFSNISDYAYTEQGATVTIKTELKDNLYSITFIDTGKKYNPLKHSDPDVETEMKDKDIGGLGIYLAKKLSDSQSYTYHNKQNILTISIDINK
jgi:anti-sigma regulatory factor (Ser/Thr protein kinase)